MKQKTKLTNYKLSTALVLAFLIFSLIAVSVANAAAEGDQVQNNLRPGVPDNALQYNRTDIVPSGEQQQVRAMETYVFNYRNLTLALNCTRTCEFNFTADPNLNPKHLWLSIDPVQNMSFTMNMTLAPQEAEMIQTRNLNFYLEIEPNATIGLNAQIRLYINQTELAEELNREINASRLTWQYFNRSQNQWVNVPSWIDENNYIVCNTTHFSSWTVTELIDEETPQQLPTPTATTMPITTPSLTTTPATSQTPIEPITSTTPTSPTEKPEASPSTTQQILPTGSAQPVMFTQSNETTLIIGIAAIVAIVAAIASISVVKRKKIA